MIQIIRSIPAAPKRPPAPQAKPVPYAARNTAFSVTTGARGRLTTPATARTPADASAATATQLRMKAAAAAPKPPPASQEKSVKNAARNTAFSVTTGARGRLTATARTPAAARAAPKLRPQAVPVAQQPAPPKRSVRCVVGNTAKKTPITMLWCIPVQKPPPVRKSAGTLTTSASAAAIPPAKSCPH